MSHLAKSLALARELEATLQSSSQGEIATRLRTTDREGEQIACIREAVLRQLGLRLYDEQLQAGLTMMRGELAEMATGEGKTLAASIPAAVGALEGKGVHVATVNTYLARRDEELLRPVYEFLGLRSAFISDEASAEQKRAAYAADITYGSGYGFGFDFLRDRSRELSIPRDRMGQNWLNHLVGNQRERNAALPLQRPLAFAVVDEIDSVLIDEAMTPLVLSQAPKPGKNPAAPIYIQADGVARKLRKNQHYTVSGNPKRIELTPEGISESYSWQKDLPQALMKRAWHHYVQTALQARILQKSEVHYLIVEDKIEMIDPSTGRRFSDRKWRNGLHQAVEAKEKVTITHETESDVSISRQQFYRLYPRLCGMTGTAWETRRELKRVYGLKTRRIPRHRPLQLEILPPLFFPNRKEMIQMVVDEVRQQTSRNRPVLIGTRSVERSEEVSQGLSSAGISHAVLNARQDAEEAQRISEAGEAGQVTVATNMAGRGADIPLGPGVAEAGGIHVLGVEWNDAARIDRQLAGRAGRQGQPGSYRKIASKEDPLLEIKAWATGLRGLKRCQREAERESYRKRKLLMRHNKWLDKLKDHA